MDFDELVAALTALEGVEVRLQVGTRDHDHVALEATGRLHVEAVRTEWALFTLGTPPLKLHLWRSEFGEVAGPADPPGPLRLVTSGVKVYVVIV